MKYKTMKVFDCQDMPDALRQKYYDYEQGHNDCILKWNHIDELDEDVVLDFEYNQSVGLVIIEINKWLRENGATNDDVVAIKHWW